MGVTKTSVLALAPRAFAFDFAAVTIFAAVRLPALPAVFTASFALAATFLTTPLPIPRDLERLRVFLGVGADGFALGGC